METFNLSPALLLSYDEIKPLGRQALSIFSVDSVIRELEFFRTRLLDSKVSGLDLCDDDVTEKEDEIIDCILHLVGSSAFEPTSFQECRGTHFSESAFSCLDRRLTLLQASLSDASCVCVDNCKASGLLLPTSLYERLEQLLSKGELPIAWVYSFDLT